MVIVFECLQLFCFWCNPTLFPDKKIELNGYDFVDGREMYREEREEYSTVSLPVKPIGLYYIGSAKWGASTHIG